MTKRAARPIRCIAFVAMLVLACVVPSVAYAKDADLGVNVGSGIQASSTFSLKQSGIKDDALSLVREYRQDALNDTRVKFLYGDDAYTMREYLRVIGMSEEEYLSPQWSNSLERIAIQRAAEANLAFEHTRPNGESCFSASHGDVKSTGEILAYSTSIEGGMAMWASEKADYIASGGEWTNYTGHYYQLISPTYRFYGFASVGGCCAGEASSSVAAGGFAESTNLEGDYEITMGLPVSVLSDTILTPSATSVDVDDSVEINATFTYRYRTFSSPVALTSSNPAVAKVSGSTVTGMKFGTVTLTMTLGEETRSFEFAVGARVMYRLYNQWTGEHFYTASATERDGLVAVGWTDEGLGWVAPTSGDPVYRLYNPYVAGGDHHYTLSQAERDSLMAAGWRYEGVGWRSAPAATGVPLYRQYNPYATTGTHNYTTSRAENDHLVSVGWREEGVGWYGV